MIFNRVDESEDILQIRTFPTLLGGLLLVVAGAIIYGMVVAQLKVVDMAIASFVVAVFAVLLEFKVATFNKQERSVMIETRRLTGKRVTTLSFDEIQGVGIRTGKGSQSNSGVVTLRVDDDEVSITTMASLPRRKQTEVVNRISEFLMTN